MKKKYGKNKQKYQEEMMKLYEKEGFNPMSGCLPMLIQFPILFGVIVGDAGYGLIYLALALLGRKILMRMGEMGAKAFKIILGCGISTVIFGLLYSESSDYRCRGTLFCSHVTSRSEEITYRRLWTFS